MTAKKVMACRLPHPQAGTLKTTFILEVAAERKNCQMRLLRLLPLLLVIPPLLFLPLLLQIDRMDQTRFECAGTAAL